MKQSFYDLNFSDLETVLRQNDLNDSAASVLFNWHYKKKEQSQCTTNISKHSLAFFQDYFDFSLPEIDTVQESNKDRSVKFLFKLYDCHKIETVLIPFHNILFACHRKLAVP